MAARPRGEDGKRGMHQHPEGFPGGPSWNHDLQRNAHDRIRCNLATPCARDDTNGLESFGSNTEELKDSPSESNGETSKATNPKP